MDMNTLVRFALNLTKSQAEIVKPIIEHILDKNPSKEDKQVKTAKKQADKVVSIFAGHGMKVEPKKLGRKPDPNSGIGKVRTFLMSVLRDNEVININDYWAPMMRETGLSLNVCKTNAKSIPGIMRNWGKWSLADQA